MFPYLITLAVLFHQVLSPNPPTRSLAPCHPFPDALTSRPGAPGAGWLGTAPALAAPGSVPWCGIIH